LIVRTLQRDDRCGDRILRKRWHSARALLSSNAEPSSHMSARSPIDRISAWHKETEKCG
jgi:hypothetical protein